MEHKVTANEEVQRMVQLVRTLTLLDVDEITSCIERAVELGAASTVAIEAALTGGLDFPPVIKISQFQKIFCEAREKIDKRAHVYGLRHYESKGYLAKQWLIEVLTETMPVSELMVMANDAGHLWWAVFAAKRELEIVSVKPDADSGWLWLPPVAKTDDKTSKV